MSRVLLASVRRAPSGEADFNGGGKLIREAPWIALCPAMAITITGLGLNLLGDALHDALDPRLPGLDRRH